MAAASALAFYAALSWLVPWLWSGRIDEAGIVVIPLASALAFGAATVSLLLFIVTRDQRAGAAREADLVPRGAWPVRFMMFGALLIASLFNVDYGPIQTPMVLAVGLLILGAGAAFLLPVRSRRTSARREASLADVIVPFVAIGIGIVLFLSPLYEPYYPGQRTLMLTEGVVLSGAGATFLAATLFRRATAG